MFTIHDALRRKLETFRSLDLPDGDGWQRLDCLACGNDRAVVNHKLGWYECYRPGCIGKVSAGADASIITRFGPQIGQAARSIRASYGKWIEQWEAEQYAAERVLTYAGEPRDGDCDAGNLPDWQLDVKNDPDQLDRFVLRALNADLSNYARGKVRKARKESAGDPADWNWDAARNLKANASRAVSDATRELPDYGFSAREFPYLYAREVQGYTVEQVAARYGVSPRTVKRTTRAERARLAGVTGRAA